jgi:hypothetical protein
LQPAKPLGLAILASSLAGSGAAAGDTSGLDVRFRDETGRTVVLALYPEGSSPLFLEAFRVRGPRVGWVEEHPWPRGTEKWRVIVKSAPTTDGPWTVESRTRFAFIVADRAGSLDAFDDRRIGWQERPGQRFVRLVSLLAWVNEDGRTIDWVQHQYTDYGLTVVESGTPAELGDQVATRRSAPNRWMR